MNVAGYNFATPYLVILWSAYLAASQAVLFRCQTLLGSIFTKSGRILRKKLAPITGHAEAGYVLPTQGIDPDHANTVFVII